MAARENFLITPRNHGSKGQPDYRAVVSYRGQQRRVGPRTLGRTLTSAAEFNEAVRSVRTSIDREVNDPFTAEVPTIAEFVGARLNERGTILMDWPLGFARSTGMKTEKAIRSARESARPFVGEFGNRKPGSIDRGPAEDWLLSVGHHARQRAGQILDDYFNRYPLELPSSGNPMRGHRLGSGRRSRTDDPDFRVLKRAERDRLLAAAKTFRPAGDVFGDVAHAFVLGELTTCARPSELLACRRHEPTADTEWGCKPTWVDFDLGRIWIGSQIIGSGGEEGPPKHGDTHWLVLPPELRDALLQLPDTGSEWMFPGPDGGPMTNNHWNAYWKEIRQRASVDIRFYDLKHTGITFLVTPPPHGLGLAIQDAAIQAGHRDKGATIIKHYLKLDEELAFERIETRMREWYRGELNGPSAAPDSSRAHLEAALKANDLPEHAQAMVRAILGMLEA